MTKALKTKGFHESIVGCTGFEAIKKLAAKPVDDSIRYSLGELYYIAGDYDAAFFKWQQVLKPKLACWGNLHKAAYYLSQKQYGPAAEILVAIDSAEGIITTEKYLHLLQVYEAQKDHLNILKTYKMLLELDLRYENVYEIVSNYFESKELYSDLFRAEMFGTDTYSEAQISRVLRCLEQDQTGSLSLQQLFELFIVKLVKQGSPNIPSIIQSIQQYMEKHRNYEKGLEVFATAIKNNPKTIGHYFAHEQLKQLVNLLDGLYWHATSSERVKEVFQYVKSCFDSLTLTVTQKKVIYSYTEKSVNAKLSLDLSMSDLESFSSQLYNLAAEQQIDQPMYAKSMMDHFFNDEKKILITGRYNGGKSSFINSILDEPVLKTDIIPTTSAITVVSSHSEMDLTEWKDGVLGANSMEELGKVTTIQHAKSSALSTSIIFLQTPNPMLKELNVRFIDTPGFFDNAENTKKNPTFTNLHLADEIIFIFAAEEAFTQKEKKIIGQLIEKAPNKPISFVLNKVDELEEEEIEELQEDVERKLLKTFGENLPLYLYSSEEVDYRENMIKFLRDRQKNQSFHRIQVVLPYLVSYIEEMKKLVGEQQMKQLQKLQETNTEMKRYANYVAQVKAFCELFVEETLQTLQSVVVEPLLNRYRTTVIEYVRSLAEDLSYEKAVGPQVDELNEQMNRSATSTLIKYITDETFSADLISWNKETEIKIQQHVTKLKQLNTQVPSFESFIQEPFEQLEKGIYEQLTQLKQLKPQTVIFINKSDYDKTLLSAFGKFFGMQNNQEYMKIDELKKSLQEDSFQPAIEKFTLNITQMMDTLSKRHTTLLVEMTKPLLAHLQTNLKKLEKITNSEAFLYKQLSESKLSKIESWTLLEMKSRQLETLFK